MKQILSIFFLTLLIGCSSFEASSNEKEIFQPKVEETGTSQETVTKNKEISKEKIQTENISILKDETFDLLPERLSIPAINVDTEVEKVGVLDNGEMGVPDDFMKTGWFEPGTKPGNRGNAVIAGHVDSKTGPAVFFDLKKLKKGDEVTVTGSDGDMLTFEVVGMEVYPMDDAPVEDIFGYTSRRMLNLITCTGTFDRSRGGHIDRLVVYTELKAETEGEKQ